MTEEKKKKKTHPFKVGDTVYFHAFTKEDANMSFLCRGEVTKMPKDEKSKTFRVLIHAVADRSLGASESTHQESLLGRAINKKSFEMTKYASPLVQPKTWLTRDAQPKRQRQATQKSA